MKGENSKRFVCVRSRALPDDGALISLEIDEHHAGVARNNVERAGLSDKVEIRVGDAHELLASLIEDDEGPLDIIFVLQSSLLTEMPGNEVHCPGLLTSSRT